MEMHKLKTLFPIVKEHDIVYSISNLLFGRQPDLLSHEGERNGFLVRGHCLELREVDGILVDSGWSACSESSQCKSEFGERFGQLG